METRNKDKYRTINFHNSSEEEDRTSGIDGWIETMAVAGRRMHRSINEYYELSLREVFGIRSEIDKIKDGSFLATLYIFEFDDAYVITKVDDLRKALKDDLFRMAPNTDGRTAGHYIEIGLIPNLIIAKSNFFSFDDLPKNP